MGNRPFTPEYEYRNLDPEFCCRYCGKTTRSQDGSPLPVEPCPSSDGILDHLQAENERLKAELAALKKRIEESSEIYAAADTHFAYVSTRPIQFSEDK